MVRVVTLPNEVASTAEYVGLPLRSQQTGKTVVDSPTPNDENQRRTWLVVLITAAAVVTLCWVALLGKAVLWLLS